MNGPVPTLKARLDPIAARQRRLQLACTLAATWAAAALLGLTIIILQRLTGWSSSLALPVMALLGFAAAITALIRHSKTKPTYQPLASQIQSRYPEPDGRLHTSP